MPNKANFKAAGIVLIVIFTLIICSLVFALSKSYWFPFRTMDALDEWEEKIFKGRVLYTVRMEKTDGYLSAYSRSACSGIMYRLRFDPQKEPLVSWKWRVLKFPHKTQSQTKGGTWMEKDDYAARFYIIFPKLAFNLTKSLEYVWDASLPEGKIFTSPYFKNIKIIVAESSDKNLGQWVYEERNIYEDFKKAFGVKPGRVGAIAIMTDTDNTLSTAEANFDDIKVGYINETR